MKISIHFIDKKTDDYIISIYADENPSPQDIFRIGQKIYFRIEEIYPKAEAEYRKKLKDKHVNHVLEFNEELQKKYNNKRYKIVYKHTTIKKNKNLEDEYSVSIEYYMKSSPKFYWKWWYIKSFFKFNKRK